MNGSSHPSSPRKSTSRRATSLISGGTRQETPPQSQDKMKEYCRHEIENDTWAFSPSDISFMLSPKSLRTGVEPGDIKCFKQAKDNCDFLIQEPFFESALNSAVTSHRDPDTPWPDTGSQEKFYYDPLVAFLNTCIANCNTALNAQGTSAPEFKERVYGNLRFQKYGKTMEDGVDWAYPLKPDIGGANGLKAGQKMYWSAGTSSGAIQMGIPVEVKPLWPRLLAQAAVYGRCLFSASPTRSWSLVLGFNSDNQNLRFLIFHRGGCTASHDIRILTQSGRREAYRLILTILLWTKSYHAGFSSFSTDDKFAIPDPQAELTRTARVEKYVHHMIAIRTRGTLVGVVSPQDLTISSPLNSSDPSHPTSHPPNLKPAVCSLKRPHGQPNTAQSGTQTSSQSKPGSKRKVDGDGKHDSEPSKRPRSNQPSPISNCAGSDGVNNSGSSAGETESNTPPIVPHNSGRSIATGIQVYRFQSGLSDEQLKERLFSEKLLLKFCWPDEDQGSIEADFLSTTSGKFGTPSHVASYQIREPSGLLVSNRIFLPGPEKAEHSGTWWGLGDNQGHEAKLPNYRDATCHLFAAIGETLLDAHSSWDLCESVVHAMLGWLNYYQHGFLHRDISIGNLLRLSDALSMTGVEIVDPFVEYEIDTNAPDVSNAKKETLDYVGKIKDLVDALEIGKECKGILIDGDMAAEWKTYFDKNHGHRTLSGTEEFMSQGLLIAKERGSPYLQSPVDDIESFFWTTFWAVLFNHDNDGSISEEKTYRGWWTTTVRCRTDIVQDMVPRKHLLSPIAQQMCNLLDSWSEQIKKLRKDWDGITLTRLQYPGKVWFIAHFHLYAYRGVYETLKLIREHQEALTKHRLFNTST